MDWLFCGRTDDRYKPHHEAVIISCFYNPQNSPYRLLAFQKWYRSIKHLNHRIIECLIGDTAKSQLPESPFISTVRTESLLWHKETLLNKLVVSLPVEYKYVFWLDADVLFTNKNWMVEGVNKLKGKSSVIQPFEYCIHLEKNELKPSFDVEAHRQSEQRHPKMWRSFCSNYTNGLSADENYDRHGHVGFAWGARREVLEQCPLYDRALIGGADHILAHAAAGHLNHICIEKSFTENIKDVRLWMQKFFWACRGRLSYVPGDLYHIWHGEIKDRQYYKRIKDFTPETKSVVRKGGFYTGNDAYVKRYYKQREVTSIYEEGFDGFDADFFIDMGYHIRDIYHIFGDPIWETQELILNDPPVDDCANPAADNFS